MVPGATTLADFASITPGVWTAAEYLTYRANPSLSIQSRELTPDWLSGAELVVVRLTNSTPIEAPLDIDAFSVAASRGPRLNFRQQF